jgi:hypothetical protein
MDHFDQISQKLLIILPKLVCNGARVLQLQIERVDGKSTTSLVETAKNSHLSLLVGIIRIGINRANYGSAAIW